MARISNKTLYPIDNNPESIDFLVGTNDNDGKTMSYPLGVVAEFIGEFIDDRETNHIIALGEIEVLDDNKIKINVAEGGNIVYVDGAFRSTQDPSYFNFTPIEGGIKYLYIYASNDPEIFHMIEGENGNIVVGEILPREVLPITVITLSMGGGGDGYVLPIATENKLGGIKVGETLTISSTGILDYILDVEEIEAIVTEMLPDPYELPTASETVLGGIKVGANLTIDTDGTLNASGGTQVNSDWDSTSGVSQILNKPTKTSDFTNDGENGTDKFATVSQLTPPYSLPIASSTILGGIKVGSNLSIDSNGTLSAEASFPSVGDNGDVLVKDDTEAEGVKWETLPTIPTKTSDLTNDSDFITQTYFNNNRHNYTITTVNSTPNKTWTDGVSLWFTNNLGINNRLSQGSVFVYTPTGNFNLSAVRTAMENSGKIFNDAHIIIALGTNNYTCNIDLEVNNICTIARRGSGSISFTSSRTLNAGVDNITILNGNESSIALIQCGTSVNFLTIRNK